MHGRLSFLAAGLLGLAALTTGCGTECQCNCGTTAEDTTAPGPAADVPVALPDIEEGCPTTPACDDGVYEMASLVAACGFGAAVELALADDCGGLLSPGGARVLWFPAGGDYVIDEPMLIAGTGIQIRGDGASAVGLDPPDWQTQGTVFRCDVAAGESCLTLTTDPDVDSRSGVLVEGVTFAWNDTPDKARPTDVVGLRLEGLSDSVVEQVSWDDFPGTGLLVSAVSGSSFRDLVFYATGEAARTALRSECTEADEPGYPIRCPNDNVLERVHVEGYPVGVWFVGGNAITLRDGAFYECSEHALVVDGVESLLVSGCRFQDSDDEQGSTGAHVYVIREEGWWFPDVVLDTAYFQCRCSAGRYPVHAEVPATGAVPRTRVALRTSTFRDCALGPLLRGDVFTLWQCSDNRVLQRVSADPSRYETYVLDDCSTEEVMPLHPETCVE